MLSGNDTGRGAGLPCRGFFSGKWGLHFPEQSGIIVRRKSSVKFISTYAVEQNVEKSRSLVERARLEIA